MDSMNNDDWINKKFSPLPGEFVHKNIPYCSWSKLEFIQRVENDDIFYPDDVLIATYPKSGTTVFQEIVWLVSNNTDIESAKKENLVYRFPFMDEHFEHNYEKFDYRGQTINILNKLPRPRFLKTHLAYRNLEVQMDRNPGMKVLTCFRNPKDTAVSMYHFYKGVQDYGPFTGTWDDFFERWLDGWIAGGDWLDIVTEWWSQRHRKNFKIIFFEDIVSNKGTVLEELCTFLDKTISNEDLEKIIEHTEFKSMKTNPSTNYETFDWSGTGFVFMRKGQIGDWKNYFTEEQNKRLHSKYDSVLEECGLKFRYE